MTAVMIRGGCRSAPIGERRLSRGPKCGIFECLSDEYHGKEEGRGWSSSAQVSGGVNWAELGPHQVRRETGRTSYKLNHSRVSSGMSRHSLSGAVGLLYVQSNVYRSAWILFQTHELCVGFLQGVRACYPPNDCLAWRGSA